MASIRWQGGGAAVSQVQTWTFAGTWNAADVVTVAMGSKSYAITTGSTVIATLLATVQAALAALSTADFPEYGEVTWSNTSTTLVGTATTGGIPFTATISTNSAAGTINGGASSTGTATTASSGPNDWSTAANWSTGSVPAGSDSVYLDNNSDDITYGLAQSGVTLTLLSVAASFTGTIGLPERNSNSGYEEYRTRFLTISATTCNVGYGPGNGSGRILLNVGTNACTLTVFATGSGLETNLEALLWKGTNAGNVVNVLGGQVGIAAYQTDTATVATLRVAGTAQVRCGLGTTLTTVNLAGSGTLVVNTAATTVQQEGGTLTVYGSGAVTTLNVIPPGNTQAVCSYQSTGTVTTATVGTGGVIDCTSDTRGRTFTNTNLYQNAVLTDSFGTVTFTNPIQLVHCRIGDVQLDVGTNRTVAIAGSAP